ncbi:MAG: hypothetical protein C3F12_12470 [Candidatus Methylomirabilota bacterium]|nr:type II toxin-antitoxin system Phd/YefM family antitoxin [Candidatus Methylomirabilis sp.]NJD67862.1 type II toxin-antitoxin system Phd/YefM family antitoxin [candidate division NC10 bacterium]PWB43486.1 MAG: hypothetical protein C3F12_12470 [candidate division NC10 bacterium]
MGVRIPVSEARKQLSQLLKQVQENPDLTYEITVNDIVLGELVTPKGQRRRLGTGAALLRAAEEIGEPDSSSTKRHAVARDHDVHLYHRKGK